MMRVKGLSNLGPFSGLRRRWNAFLPYLFISPAVIVTFFFGLSAVFFTLFVSFIDWNALDGMTAFHFVGLDNYRWVLADDDWFGNALTQTLWLLVVGSFLVQVSAICLAFFVHSYLLHRLRSLLCLYFMPLLVPSVAFIFVFNTMFGLAGRDFPTMGFINGILIWLHDFDIGGVKLLAWLLPERPVAWARYMDAIWAFAMWLRFTGWNFMWYIAALIVMPSDQIEAAKLDGAKPWQVLVYIVLPYLKPTLFFACSMTFVSAMVELGSVGDYMFWLSFRIGDFGAASAIGVIVFAILALLIWLLWRYACGSPDMIRMENRKASRHPIRTGLGRAWETVSARLGQWLIEPTTPGSRLRGFDGMRAIACLLVIFHHMCLRVDESLAMPWVFHPLIKLGLKSDAGVCLFFVLSGALLSYPFWKNYLEGLSPPSLFDYAVRRFSRIAPAYWLALGVCVFVGLSWMPSARFVFERALAGTFFVSSLHYVSFFPSELNPTFWSISLEVICYALLPLLILPAWRVVPERDPRRMVRYLVWVLTGLQLAHFVIVGGLMTDNVEKGWSYGMIGGAKEWLPYWNPASFMTQFMLGSCAAFAIAWRSRLPRPAVGEDYDRVAAWALFASFMAFAFLGRMGLPNMLTRQPYITPILPALVALSLYGLHFSARIADVLDNRVFRFIAKISFGLYLWHWPVMEALRIYVEPLFRTKSVTSGLEWLALFLAVLMISGALASLSSFALERPIQSWVSRRLARSGKGASVGLPAVGRA